MDRCLDGIEWKRGVNYICIPLFLCIWCLGSEVMVYSGFASFHDGIIQIQSIELIFEA